MSSNHYYFRRSGSESQKKEAIEHSYVIRAMLVNNVLEINAFDSITGNEWREEFIEANFEHKLIEVAKVLVNAIKSFMSNDNNNAISIFENNNMVYLQVNNANLPSFILKPIRSNHDNHNNNNNVNNNICYQYIDTSPKYDPKNYHSKSNNCRE